VNRKADQVTFSKKSLKYQRAGVTVGKFDEVIHMCFVVLKMREIKSHWGKKACH